MELPVIITLDKQSPDSFIRYYQANKAYISSILLKEGAVKFKNINIRSFDDFSKIVAMMSDEALDYVDGNSPRTKLTGNVYTSTEYDKAQKITMHNELSYSAKWPGKLYFNCLQVAESGGETLLSDSREILKRMDSTIVTEIRNRGIVYIRNLHGGIGFGPSWQETFETDDPANLETYCKSLNIKYEWMPNGHLRLMQHSDGVIRHRHTGEWLWFNQIDQFHPVHLGEELYNLMQDMYASPDDFPMYVQFGDGGLIGEDIVKEITHTIDEMTIAPGWEENEFLIVDNELVCHGRNAYTGNRKVLVSMSK